jgi:arylsulfatase
MFHVNRILSLAAVVAIISVAGCTNDANTGVGPSTAANRALDAGSRPNILLIVADDLGQTDLGIYGSEIRTPNLDRLAARGTLLTNYYASPLCAPTRSMLLSGTDNHRAGEGLMDSKVEGADGYEGFLNHRVVSLATRLRAVGYHTYMAGKWHLGYGDDQSAANHGFERSFTLLPGGASHFDMTGMGNGTAQYRDNGRLVDSLPQGFYSTTFYTDKILEYIDESAEDDQPFFAYLAYTAPHWPMHAPDEDIARQQGRYDDGYEVLRQRRFEAWKASGFASEDSWLPNLPSDFAPWSSLTPEQQAKSSRAMEVYAAMVERMDTEVGRVLAYLEESGRLDNTLILFQSDNGAEGGFGPGGASYDNIALEDIGRPGSWVFVGRGWAEAQSAPYFLQKFYTAEGGIHVPAFVYGPALGVPSGLRNDSVLIAADVAPTFLELAGANTAAPDERPDALPITGRSFAGVLRGESSSSRGDDVAVGWEHSGNAAVRRGDWKLLWVGSRGMFGGGPPPGGGQAPAGGAGDPNQGGQPAGGPAAPPGGQAPGAGPGAPPGGGPPGRPGVQRSQLEQGEAAGDPVGTGGPWRLFNLRDDPAELCDLSAEFPDIKAEMLAEWDRYVAENGVIVKQGSARDEP